MGIRSMSPRRDVLLLILIVSVLLNAFFLYAHYKNPTVVATFIHGPPEADDREIDNTVCPYFRGGLGNFMFQYASVYGMAKLKKFQPLIPSNSELFKVFNLSGAKTIDGQVCSSFFTVVEKRPCAYDVQTVNFENSKVQNYVHKSYLQSWKYFANADRDIRQQFAFKKHIQDKATSVMRNLTGSKTGPVSRNLTIVGVHIRRGDYTKPHNIKYGYQLATKDYITKALKYFRDRHKSVKFLVFTNPNKDDVAWCTKNVQGQDVQFVSGNQREVDLCLLSMCNHTIMTVGSFGWWGSYLANGTTLYFKDVAKKGSQLRGDFSDDMSDFFYPGWIGL